MKTEKLVLTRDLESMLISAERYAVGRRTYIVSMTVDYLICLLPKLSDWCVDILLRDMNDQRGMVDRSGNFELWGDDCDRRDWERFITALEKEMGKRKNG